MQQANQMSLLRQVRVVLLSYLTRPGLLWNALAICLGSTIYECALAIAKSGGHSSPHGDTAAAMLAVFSSLVMSCGAVGILLVFMLHARQQLVGWQTRVLPHTRTANLIVAGAILPLFAAVAAFLDMHEYGHFLGLFIVFFGVLILAGYAFARPWLLVVLVAGGWMTLKYTSLESLLDQLSTDREYIDWHRGSQAFPAFVAYTVAGETPDVHEKELMLQGVLRRERLQVEYQLLRTERIAAFLGELLAFLALGAVVRPSRRSIFDLLRSNGPQQVRKTKAQFPLKHSFITSRLSRSLHRRVAAHDWRAAGVTAVAMGLLSGWFNLQFQANTALTMLTLMLAILPGALVAIGWRERWPAFEFESLYPVSRGELVTDMAAALALDLAEFWIASALAIVAVCAALRGVILHDSRFWTAMFAGGMMQFLWLGGIFFVGQRRQLISYIAGLTPLVLAISFPLESLWQRSFPLSPKAALLIAAIEMLIGLAIFLITWAWLLRAPRANTVDTVQLAT